MKNYDLVLFPDGSAISSTNKDVLKPFVGATGGGFIMVRTADNHTVA